MALAFFRTTGRIEQKGQVNYLLRSLGQTLKRTRKNPRDHFPLLMMQMGNNNSASLPSLHYKPGTLLNALNYSILTTI